VVESYSTVRCTQGIEHGSFLNTGISQGSVAMHLRCGRIFNKDFIANLLVSPPVKEL